MFGGVKQRQTEVGVLAGDERVRCMWVGVELGGVCGGASMCVWECLDQLRENRKPEGLVRGGCTGLWVGGCGVWE